MAPKLAHLAATADGSPNPMSTTLDVPSPGPGPAGPPPPGAHRSPATPAPATAADRAPRWYATGSLAAVFTWLAGTVVAFAVVRLGRFDPMSVRAATMPVSLGGFGFAVLLALAWRRGSDTIMGVMAGAYGAWVALTMRAALKGTPFGYGGLVGDARRITAQAARYATTWHSADASLPGQPSDYPPLYTWLIGRASAATGTPAWQLVGTVQAVMMSATVVAAFLLWRRLVSAPVALVLATLAFVADANPIKPYEVITLAVGVPWLLGTFANPPRGRLHWLVSGVVGGLIAITYQAHLVYMSLGVAALAWWTYRSEARPRRYLGYLARVAGTAVVVSSWYVVPYLYATATQPSSFSSDTYQSAMLGSNPLPLPFMGFASAAGVVELIGLVGLVWLYRRVWWARPLSALLLGTYAFIVVASLRFAVTGHNMFFHYAAGTVAGLLVTAGVLTVVDAVRLLTERGADADGAVGPGPLAARTATLRRVVAVVTVGFVASQALAAWHTWSPTIVPAAGWPHVAADATKPADLAQQETPPDGSTLPYGPVVTAASPTVDGWLPVDLISAAVTTRLGANARPVIVSADDRLFAYLPWYQWVAFSPTTSPGLAQWAKRDAFIRSLATQSDPTRFAEMCAHTPFGAIDAFLLRTSGTGLRWRDLTFSQGQFSGQFDQVPLPNDYVLYVRRS
jgi:hypothetical protein